MSQIIDLFQQIDIADKQPYTVFKQILISIFKSQQYNLKNTINNNQQTITFIFNKSDNTLFCKYSTIWSINFYNNSNVIIQIMFYNVQQDDILRVYTDRYKIQVALIIRYLNLQIMPNYYFIIDTESGALKLVNVLPGFYKVSKKQTIQQLILQLFIIIKRYDQLFMFMQPQVNFVQQTQINNNMTKILTKLNKLRMIINQTASRRLTLQAHLNDLIKIKQMPMQYINVFVMQQMQLSHIFMHNVKEFQLSQLGLENFDGFKQIGKDQAFLREQYAEKNRNQRPTNKNNSNAPIDADKIVNGIYQLIPIVQNNEPIDSSQQQDNKPQQIGSHSQIAVKKLSYMVVDSINAGTLNFNIKQQQMPVAGKKKQGQLTLKICNIKQQTSRNSFLNQLSFLKYVRDMYSPFIARYYLQVKANWNEKDIIYMNTYQQNLFDLIRIRKTLSVKSRLQLSYRITKGLCFLFTKQVVHRDFKPPNVVVDSFMQPKIIDFGSCTSHYKDDPKHRKFKPYQQRLLSTPGFHIAYTKIIQQYKHIAMKFNRKSYQQHPLFDVYGLGKTICYIFFNSLKLPSPEQIKQNKPYSRVYENIIFLIDRCLQVDPDDRPCFGQIITFLGVLNELVVNAVNPKSQSSSDQETMKQQKNKKVN